MSLYNIIQALHNVSGNNDKQAILDANKDNELLKAYMKAVMDPAINYYITKLPKVAPGTAAGALDASIVEGMVRDIAGRVYTGKRAVELLKHVMVLLDVEGQQLLEYIIKRKLGTSKVGETMVLNTWPGLFFVPPYMRCKSMDPKIVEHYAKLHRFYVQPKRDGSFAYAEVPHEGAPRLITRAGSVYPEWFARLITCGVAGGVVLMGELEVYAKTEMGLQLLDRKTGNGILGSIEKGADMQEFNGYHFSYVAWDVVTVGEFSLGLSVTEYWLRLERLDSILSGGVCPYIVFTEFEEVTSVEEAFAINTKLTTAGKEGTVWKTLSGGWRDTGSGTKDMVKLKVKFQVECKVTGAYEGEGKAAGMLGGFNIATSDYKLQCGVGSGFSDDQRKDFWAEYGHLHADDFDEMNLIATIEANDVITNKKRPDALALSLPIFVELRSDRKTADTLDRVIEQRDAARMGK